MTGDAGGQGCVSCGLKRACNRRKRMEAKNNTVRMAAVLGAYEQRKIMAE
jgi:hypothetical protein